MSGGLLFVLSGPSGVGKDTVLAGLKEQCFPIRFAVTATTRPPRQGEIHGVDYLFVSNGEFDRLIAEDELLEWALVHGRHYGVPRGGVRGALRNGQDVLMRIDVQGAATIRARVPGAVLIFLAPPSMETLISRLRARATESDQELEVRIANAREEMKRLPEFDYQVVNHNGQRDRAVEEVKAIILAEKCRVTRRQVVV